MEQQISYFAHEGMLARMERMNHRLWIVIILLIVCLVASNLAWIIYESQWEYYEETTQEVTQEASSESGIAKNIVVGGNYGESKADD